MSARQSVPTGIPAAMEFPVRVLVGILLAAAAFGAIWAGGVVFALFVAAGGAACAREWHRMLGNGRFGPEAVLTGGSILAASLLAMAMPGAVWIWTVLPLGALAAGAISAARGTSPWWNGAGALYIGIPALCAVYLRDETPHGFWIVFYLFLVTWSGDTGALMAGKALKGPKLVPALSPNKTWAGLAGGVALPAIMGGALALGAGGDWRAAAGFAAAFALTGHAGDLFESLVKRRVGRKNSGSLIPGHGGILDRVDSCLFVCAAGALVVFGIGIDPVFGAWR